MTDFLPLFPLKLVVYPGENLNLHIFEPRYKQLIRECQKNKITFGIPPYVDNQVQKYATEVRLLSVENVQENGEMDIKTVGAGLVRIDNFYPIAPNKLYGGADISRIAIEPYSTNRTAVDILEKLSLLFEILKVDKKLPSSPENFNTYRWAHFVGFNLQQEYQLLCLTAEDDRQAFMLEHLDRMIPIVQQMEQLKKKAQLNGHFKNVIPPKF